MAEEKTVEQLQTELTEKETRIAELEAAVEKSAKDREEDNQMLQQLSNDNDQLKEKNEALETENAELRERKAPEARPTFEVNGEKYEILVGAVRIPGLSNGGRRTALEVSVDEEAQAALLKAGSGVIKKLV